MTNTKSELYEKHPDWIVNALGREPVTGRGGTQLVLDLGNPEVRGFCIWCGRQSDDQISRT